MNQQEWDAIGMRLFEHEQVDPMQGTLEIAADFHRELIAVRAAAEAANLARSTWKKHKRDCNTCSDETFHGIVTALHYCERGRQMFEATKTAHHEVVRLVLE